MAKKSLRNRGFKLYARADSKNWYGSYRLPGGKRTQESLKTSNRATAEELAEERYEDIRIRTKYGMTQKTVSFAEAADAWLLDLEMQVAGGGRKERNVVDYAPTIER